MAIVLAVPTASTAARFLTRRKADRRYIRIVGAERGGAGSLTATTTPTTVSDVQLTTKRPGFVRQAIAAFGGSAPLDYAYDYYSESLVVMFVPFPT